MPRKIEETLIGVGWGIRQVEVPVTDENGQPVFNGGTGGPKTETQWILDLIDQGPTELRVLHIPFAKDAKDKLVEALTGGIVVASSLPQGPVI